MLAKHIFHRPDALLDSSAFSVSQLAVREGANILEGDQQVAPAIREG